MGIKDPVGNELLQFLVPDLLIVRSKIVRGNRHVRFPFSVLE
jgi:hypothetical protein